MSPKEEGIRGCYLMSPNFPQLPFSVIGSLNGVHMFGQNLEVQLSSARTKDTTVVWKSFHDRSQVLVWSRDRGLVIALVEDDPKSFQLSKASCLLGCGISDKPVISSDP